MFEKFSGGLKASPRACPCFLGVQEAYFSLYFVRFLPYKNLGPDPDGWILIQQSLDSDPGSAKCLDPDQEDSVNLDPKHWSSLENSFPCRWKISPKVEENHSFPLKFMTQLSYRRFCDTPTLGCSARIRGCVLWVRWPTVAAAMSFRQVHMLTQHRCSLCLIRIRHLAFPVTAPYR